MPTFSASRPRLARWRRTLVAIWQRPALVPAAAWAAVLAPTVEVSLRQLGLKPTLRWVEHMPKRGRSSATLTIDEAEHPVRWAFKCQPWLRGLCLERSLVQLALHRRAGTAARLVIGVRRLTGDAQALDAHAWVEVSDDPSIRFTDIEPPEATEAA